jgi:hypothetical protein
MSKYESMYPEYVCMCVCMHRFTYGTIVSAIDVMAVTVPSDPLTVKRTFRTPEVNVCMCMCMYVCVLSTETRARTLMQSPIRLSYSQAHIQDA